MTDRTFDQLTPDEQYAVIMNVRYIAFEDGFITDPDGSEWDLDPESAPEDQATTIREHVSTWPADWIAEALIDPSDADLDG